MRITVVAFDVGPVGGMERHLTEIIGGYVAAGHEVTVVARTCVLPDGVAHRFVRIPLPPRPFAMTFVVFWLLASVAVARRRVDVVHVHGGMIANRVDLYTMHFCHAAFNRMLTSRERSGPGRLAILSGWLVARLSEAAERWTLRPGRVRRVIGISRGVAAETAAQYPWLADRVRVISYGVDSERFRPDGAARAAARDRLGFAPDDLVAVFVGGDWRRKGLHETAEAVRRRPAWRLLVVGTGPEGEREAIASALGARATFAGRQADVVPFLRAADAFVFPTRYETFSLATHEAAATGLPLVVAPVHGVEDILRDGENGFPVSADPDVLAAALERLEAAGPARVELGRAARDAVAELTWAVAVRRHLDLLDELDARP